MSSRRERFQKLTIRDRLNYSYVLAEYEIRIAQVLDLQNDPDMSQFRAFVNWLLHTIPDDWKDKEFWEELKRAQRKILMDVRPEICGVPLSFEHCESRGIPIYQEVSYWDPYKQHQAIINLWNRRGLLSRVRWRELSTGRKFEGGGEVDLEEEDILGDHYE